MFSEYKYLIVNLVFPISIFGHSVSFLYFFWHVKDFGAARDGDAEGDGHTMGNDALTKGPMSSRSPPKLKLFIIVCPSRVKID